MFALRALHAAKHITRAITPANRSLTTSAVARQQQGKGKILCSDPIDKECIAILEKAGFEVDQLSLKPAELLEKIHEYRGLIVRSGTTVTAEVLERGTQLELIGRAGTGVDNIDIQAANKFGKIVMNTPGGNTNSAAEMTMALMLSDVRQLPHATQSLKEGRWDRKKYMGSELRGKTVGVIGLGRIGRQVAEWCKAFKMDVLGFDPIMTAEAAREHGIEKVSLDQIYAAADFITIHTPMTAETRNLINKDTLAKCKDGVRIINCARGGIVNEVDLLAAIESGKVAGAALDAYSKEPPTEEIAKLLARPEVVCTPHLGASTREAQSKVAEDIAHQFVKAFTKNEYSGVVNAPFIGLTKQANVAPFLDLADRMGTMQSQLVDGSLRSLTLNLYGKAMAKVEIGDVVANATLKGMLSAMVDEPVNLINAPHLAAAAGLKPSVNRFDAADGIPGGQGNAIEIIATTDNGTFQLKGCLYDGDKPRIIQIDNYTVEMAPAGNFLISVNDDKPGVVAALTSAIAQREINIADMTLGRRDNKALSVVHTDTAVEADAIESLRSIPAMRRVRAITLPALNANAAAGSSRGGAPNVKPANPNFGSGPCTKRPGYDLAQLPTDMLGRSHRSAGGKGRLNLATAKAKEILGIPADYSIGIVPASDTGAVEMAMWGLLGLDRPVDIVFMESFGKDWHTDATKQLKLNVNAHESDYGTLPDLTKVDTANNDVVFTWNGTTSGVKMPNGDWIAADRKGLTICDATSAAFAMDLPWDKLDVTTFSWQKVLGGEAAHGVIVASPRAMERFEQAKASRPWPMPKIFRFSPGIFEGTVINTPSMLCVEDFIDALTWSESIGGLEGLKKRSNDNLAVIAKFVKENDWISFLARDPATVSNTSVCLTLDGLDAAQLKKFTALLESEGVAYDIGGYRAAPPGIRIWAGATIETQDMKKLMPWLKHAYTQVKGN